MDLLVRMMVQEDIESIVNGFKAQEWNKERELYERYMSEQKRNERKVLIAFANGDFAGYITVVWGSPDTYFSERHIPEIKDFNVLLKYRKMGIGSRLMDEVETIVAQKSNVVGLLSDYGNAQRMYVKRGYVPNGEGISYNGKQLQYFDEVSVDDDLVLTMTKTLS